MKVLSFGIMFAAVALVFVSCDKNPADDNDPCGAAITDVWTVDKDKLPAMLPPDNVTYRYGGSGANKVIVIQFSKLFENVCPDQHVSVSASFAEDSQEGDRPTVSGRVTWYFLWERELVMLRKGSFWEGSVSDIGLKQVFKEDPGWFSVIIEVSFWANGEILVDWNTFIEHFNEFTVTTRYKAYKPKT